MLEIFLTTSSNREMIFTCYLLLGSLILMIPHYIADFRMIRETYKTGDGVEVNHKQLSKLSDDYQEYIHGNLLFNPLAVLMVYVVVSCIFFAIPGYLIADLFDTNFFIIPHFIVYVALVYWTLLSKEYKEERKNTCDKFAKNVFISNKKKYRLESEISEEEEIHSSTEDVHPLQKEKNESKGESSPVPLIPHSVSVIQAIAADDSLPLDIREDAREALRAYEAKQEQEKEEARVEDARISLEVAKKMLE